jgi:hypothetical protein
MNHIELCKVYTMDVLWTAEQEDYKKSNIIHEVQLEAEVEEVVAGQDHTILR